jgi:hypothetical protein
MAKIMRKPLPPVMSWWSERRNLLTSLKPKPVRVRPKIKKVTAKAKPQRIQVKKVVKAKKTTKAKKVMKMKKTTKGKKTKAKRTK